MDFTINGTKYTIKLVDEATINNEMKNSWCLGLTNWETQEILLRKNQQNILKTLKHELTHVWLYEYGHNQDQKQFNAEDVCEIVASIHDFVENVLDLFKYYSGFSIDKSIDETPKTTKKSKKKK